MPDEAQNPDTSKTDETVASRETPAKDKLSDSQIDTIRIAKKDEGPRADEERALAPLVSARLADIHDTGETAAVVGTPPWTLQQFFNGEIDLDIELSKRFPNMPVLSQIRFRTLGTQSKRGVATLSTQDESASVIFDADATTKVVQISYTYGSMITLRFTLDDISDMDRGRWLELMRRDQGGLAFLWGPSRWDKDYMICIARKYFTNIYAFSPRNFEAAIRVTPIVGKELLDWLEKFWKSDGKEEKPPDLLTW